MQDTNRDGPITPLPAATFAALAPVTEEYTAPDGTQVKVVPHDVYIHQKQGIAKARKRRKLAEASHKRQRDRK